MQIFFQSYPAGIQELITELRKLICEAIPGAKEEIDSMANMLAFNIAPGYKGTVFTLIPTEDHVTVGFYGGASLPDPHGLLMGKGVLHRHVKINTLEQLHTPEFTELIRVAVVAAKDRLSQ